MLMKRYWTHSLSHSRTKKKKQNSNTITCCIWPIDCRTFILYIMIAEQKTKNKERTTCSLFVVSYVIYEFFMAVNELNSPMEQFIIRWNFFVSYHRIESNSVCNFFRSFSFVSYVCVFKWHDHKKKIKLHMKTWIVANTTTEKKNKKYWFQFQFRFNRKKRAPRLYYVRL